MRFGHLAAMAATAAALIAGTVLGVVGAHDRCPAPAPPPPPGTGAARTHNSDFEEGFADGVAEGWVGFQDLSYKQRVHLVGLDRSWSGGYAQKLILPPPAFENPSAGLYQQIWVIPGETYTASVRVYLDPPPQQTFDGEDLAAWIGLDAYGGTGGDGVGAVWSPGGVTPRRWLTLSTRVKAVLPVMTVVLKAARPSLRQEGEARVWFDDVVIEG